MVALNPQLAKAADAVAADPSYLRRSSYMGLVGEQFVVDWWGSSDILTLVSVSDLGTPDVAGRDDAFSLTFSGAPTLEPGKAGLPLRNRYLGRFELFVGRIDPGGATQLFEAVVNRSVGVARRKAPQPPSSGGKKPAPVAHPAKGAVRHVSARRTAHGVRFEITLDEHSHARRAHGWLMRGERLVAAFGDVAVHDHRFAVKLPTGRRLARGSYQLVVAPGGQGAALEQIPVRLR